MHCLWSINCFFTSSSKAPFPPNSLPYPSKRPLFKKTPRSFPFLRASSQPTTVTDIIEEDVLRIFLRERQINGDFISRTCDMFWQKRVRTSLDSDGDKFADNSEDVEQDVQCENDDGFLKLSRTQNWVLGDNPAPMNKKATSKALHDDSDRRRKLNFLKYEALKREFMLLSVSIGTACSGYCLIALSVQAAVSYAVGVIFSCVYLQLLYQYVDNLSVEMIPQIFLQKKSKKIGVRSEDLRDALEKLIKGSGIVLASPRLMIPVAIYGLWVFSHRYFAEEIFYFELVPAMVGMFVYKAAALVQVYRDNEDLQFIFPENDRGSSV